MKAIIRNTQTPLHGTIQINGSKNATLAIMAAAMLTPEPILLQNVPNILDVTSMAELLQSIGAQVAFKLNSNCVSHTMIIHCENIQDTNLSPKLTCKLRAGILLLGPLLTRTGKVKIPSLGGCDIGIRAIDLHVEALEALGAVFESNEDNSIAARVGGNMKTLVGTSITPSRVSIGATENLLMAATLAEGITVIRNAACEPDITDLANFLVKMGARIQGIGTKKLTIHGVARLHGCEHSIIPDRHEAATYALAAIMTGGRLELTGIRKHHLSSVSKELVGIGGKIRDNSKSGSIVVKRQKGSEIKPLSILTDPYPNFPTDMQPQFCAALCLASFSKRTGSNTSIVYERVFESRINHTKELKKLGADICCVSINGDHQIIIRGSSRGLFGNTVVANDMRAAAALVLAGLVARGETIVESVEHLLRGYEAMDLKLNACGASIMILS